MRSSKQEHYDKRLIKKIVQEVEAGLPRKEAKQIYKLGKSSLNVWMNQYGSEHYHQNLKRRSYTKLQKHTIVTAIEQGRMTIKKARTAYNIKTEKIIRDWILRFKEEKVDIC
ncbi:MAG TPA: IS630 transposase-related protein, partial [Vicingaceae bacterium]|nr:IS630 transposase-related protein [Vicingaceae bacterium]